MTNGVEHAGEARETLREMCDTLTALVRESRQPAQRVAMSIGAVSIEVEWPGPAVTPAPAVTVPAGPPGAAAPEVTVPDTPALDTGLSIRAPLVGTFYRAPEPGAPAYVSVGDLVEPGQLIGIVEAMKLMNPVEADCRGRVEQILVRDAESVEYDQPLILLTAVDEEA